jgi:ornithine cyclodeaminase/alanine dehydrogenase-like protein (mu-crystallin family)
MSHSPSGPADPAHDTLLLSDHDIAALLDMPSCIDVMADALGTLARGDSTLPLRTVMRLPGTTNAFAAMPAIHGAGDGASLGAKIITVFPGNLDTPFDSHIGAVLLFDARHGRLLAIADASSITAIRTAAVSGLATRLLARQDAHELAILGAGVLALPHLDAIRAVRPVTCVRVWSRSGVRAHEWAERVRSERDLGGVDLVVYDRAEDAVRGADVVCTVTSARAPVLHGDWLAEGAHVNAVGASMRDARELDTAAVARARLFVDRRESARAEAGDFLIPRAEGAIDDAHIQGELGELVLGAIPGRRDDREITLFKSLGLAVEDVAALAFVHARARAAGRGVAVRLGGLR